MIIVKCYWLLVAAPVSSTEYIWVSSCVLVLVSDASVTEIHPQTHEVLFIDLFVSIVTNPSD